jgi:hypothetical protein
MIRQAGVRFRAGTRTMLAIQPALRPFHTAGCIASIVRADRANGVGYLTWVGTATQVLQSPIVSA